MASAMLAGGPAATSAWLALMTESARFVSERLREDMQTQMAFLACKSPAELLKVQTEFYQTAIEQYTAEANRMFETLSAAAEESIAEAKSGHSREYDDIPL